MSIEQSQATELVRFSEKFAKAVFTDLNTPVLQPVIAILDKHDVHIACDYRDCVAEWVKDYGVPPPENYYSDTKAAFNRSASKENHVVLIGSRSALDKAISELKDVNGEAVIEGVIDLTPPKLAPPTTPHGKRAFDAVLAKLREGRKYN